MPKPQNVEPAYLREIWWDNLGQPTTTSPSGGTGKYFQVQFNPESLKVAYANQKTGGDQTGKSPVQFVGQGTTKLSLQLWFDISLPMKDGSAQPTGDVRSLTQEVVYFMTPQKFGKDQYVPPGVSFEWGSMIFRGVMDTLDETLDFFPAEGHPLRASMNIGITQQEIKPQPPPQAPGTGQSAGGPGTQPLQLGVAGLSLQQMSANLGISDWRAVADLNGIENPRQVPVGAQLDFSAGR